MTPPEALPRPPTVAGGGPVRQTPGNVAPNATPTTTELAAMKGPAVAELAYELSAYEREALARRLMVDAWLRATLCDTALDWLDGVSTHAPACTPCLVMLAAAGWLPMGPAAL